MRGGAVVGFCWEPLGALVMVECEDQLLLFIYQHVARGLGKVNSERAFVGLGTGQMLGEMQEDLLEILFAEEFSLLVPCQLEM